MKNIEIEKNKIRKEITSLKKKYSPNELKCFSDEVLSILEITGAFQDAKTILIYNS